MPFVPANKYASLSLRPIKQIKNVLLLKYNAYLIIVPVIQSILVSLTRKTVVRLQTALISGFLLISFAKAQCPTVQGTIQSTSSSSVCSSQNGTISINVIPATGGTFSGKFTNGRVFTGLTPVAGVINPTYNFINSSAANTSETFELQELTFTDVTNTSCPAAVTDMSGSIVVTVLPLADIDAGLTTPAIICNGSSVSINITNPNGLGGTYNQQITYNGAGHTAPETANNQTYGALNDVLTNSTASAITVRYIFTSVNSGTSGCMGGPDTVYVTVNPKPVISCPGNKTQSTDANACTAVVNNIDPVSATSTTCNGVMPAISYKFTGVTTGAGMGSASGKTFNKGLTTITYYITDAASNKDSCQFTVTITDMQAPVFTTCPSNITTTADPALCGAVVTFSVAATDNCTNPVALSYSLASGSLFPIGTTTVTITATDAGGKTATCSFLVTVTNTTNLYVNDTSRVGDVYTTAAGSDLTGNGSKCAPYATIQKAIAVAGTGSTISVDAGTYREDVVVNKNLILKGANYGINPNSTGPFVKASVVQPLTSNPTAGSSILYLEPAASGSTIDGFTFDGDNTTSTSGVIINGANIDAAEGIGAYAGISATTVSNNIIKNLNYAGIDFDNFYTNSIATTGNIISGNKFSNILPAQYGAGIAIADNCYTSITNNKMDSVRLGIQTSKFFQADPGNSHSIANNTITSSRTGIWYYYIYGTAASFDITNNTINTYNGATNNNGILIDSVLETAGVAIANNRVNGAYAGVNLYNNPTSNTITVGANTFTGCSYGVFANNYDAFNASAQTASNYLIKGVTIQNATIAGIYIKDNGTSSHQAIALQISDSTVINSTATGIKLEGAAANVTFNGSKPAILTGQSIYINQVSNGTTVPASTINATTVVFDSITGSTATLAQNFKIEDKIRHKIDSAALGFVLVKANNDFVTPNSYLSAGTTASIQRAINAAAVGYIVNVDSGSFKEDVVVNKKLSLLGAGYLKTIVAGAKSGLASTLQVSASGVVIDGFKVTRDGNNTTDWNSSTLNTNGLYIQGQANDAEVRNCWLYGNYNGINISNSNSSNIHNNLIENNWVGMQFSHQTDSTLVQQNFIRNNFDHGIVFIDSSNGTNIPAQTSLGSVFNSNSIYGNWYGDVLDRQTGGTLPVAGTNLKNLECNWYGLASQPTLSASNGAEPNYATKVPTLFGGTATAPATRQPNIIGIGAANIDNSPWLTIGTDTAALIPGFQVAANSCRGLLVFSALSSAAQLCSTGGTVRMAFSGGTAPYSLTYSGPATGTVTNITSPDTVSNLSAGTYNITVTDANGYIGTDTIVVEYHPVINSITNNSYSTIQVAIDSAINGDTLRVCAGGYKEEILVNKKLTLLGPNTAIAGCATRSTEAILYPARVDYTYNSATTNHYSIMRIAADSVTVKGFTFNGDNPDSTYGFTLNGANIDIAEGITVRTAQKKLVIENNVFKNIAQAAISILPVIDTLATFGNTILNNKFNNIDNLTTNGYGTGILIGNDFYARIENNCMDTVGIGIHTANYHLLPAEGGIATISSDTITSRIIGIWHSNTYQDALKFAITNNLLNSRSGATGNTGLLLTGVKSSTGVSAIANKINSSKYGIKLINNPTVSPIKVTSGIFTNCDTAILASNYDSSTVSSSSNYVVDSTTINGGTIGIYVKDDIASTTNAIVGMTVQGNTRISGNVTGVRLAGANTGLLFNGVTPATFTGQAQYIDVASNGLSVPAATINAANVVFDNVTGAAATQVQNFAIEDKINHKIDSADLGFVLVKAKNDFVTVNSHLSTGTTAKIQRGVLAADTGFTINIATGIFKDNVSVNKRVTVLGAGQDSTTLKSVTATGNIITLTADSITVSNLYLEGSPDSVTNLSATRGIYMNSNLKSITISNVKASLHQYCVMADNAANVLGVSVLGSSFNNSGNGFGVNVSGKVANLTISNTIFNSNQYGLTSNADPATGANNQTGLMGISVTNSTFTGNTTKGMYFEKLSNAILSNNKFSNNGSIATGAGLEVNLKYGAYSNIVINGNLLDTNGYAPANGSAITVKARNDAPSYNTNTASLGSVSITNNEIRTAPVAISIGYNVDRQTTRIDSNKIAATTGIVSYSATSGSVTQAHSNSIVATQFALVNGDTLPTTINATCNWQNSTDPTIVTGKINGAATYIPYLSVGTDNLLATTGFQPAVACVACTTLTATKVKINNTCNGGSTGIITATASSGLSPYLYTINPSPVTMVQPIAGKFTGLPANIYTITGYGANGCSTTFRADTISQPTATVPDASISIPNYTDNLFLNVGSTITFLVQVTENAGNPISSALLNLTKQDGYTLGFNPSLQSLTIRGLTYPLDNTHWTLDNSNAVFSKLSLTNPNQVPCLRSVYLAFTLTRTDPNKVNFVLTSFLNNVNSEAIRNNNSTTFYLVGQ